MIRTHPSAAGCCIAAAIALALGSASAAARSPALTTNTYGSSVLTFFVGSNSELYSMTDPYAHGQFSQVTGVQGRPSLASGSGVTSEWEELFYLTLVNGTTHIEELGGSQYKPIDVSGQAKTPAKQLPASNTSIVAYPDGCAGTDNVFYVDVNHHLEWLQWSSGQPWKVTDLTAKTGTPAVAGDNLTGQESQSSKEVFFTSADGHVRELWAWSDCSGAAQFDGWHNTDVTLANNNGSPLALADSPLTSFYDAMEPLDAVFYVNRQGGLEELFLGPNDGNVGEWNNIHVGQAAGAPAVAAGSTLFSDIDPGLGVGSPVFEQVYFEDNTSNVWGVVAATGLGGGFIWSAGEVTAGTKTAKIGSPLAGDVNYASCTHGCELGDFAREFYYITPSGQVQLISDTPNPGTYSITDVTQATGAPNAVP